MAVTMPMIVIVVLMQNPNQDNVEEETEEGGDSHNLSIDVIFFEYPFDGLDQKCNRQGQQEND